MLTLPTADFVQCSVFSSALCTADTALSYRSPSNSAAADGDGNDSSELFCSAAASVLGGGTVRCWSVLLASD